MNRHSFRQEAEAYQYPGVHLGYIPLSAVVCNGEAPPPAPRA